MKKANVLRLLGSGTGFFTIFVYLWCIIYIPVMMMMIPRFKHFFVEPEPIAFTIPVGNKKTLVKEYKYKSGNDEITIPKGTAIYPLYRPDARIDDIYVRDSKGNEFILSYPVTNLDIINEKVQLVFTKDKGEESISIFSEKSVDNFQKKIDYDVKIYKSDVEEKDIKIVKLRTAKYANGNSVADFVGISADGKFLGYLGPGNGLNYKMEFSEALPLMENSSSSIPLTNDDLRDMVVGMSLGEFYQRYRYPSSVTIKEDNVIVRIPDIYSEWNENFEGRRSGLTFYIKNASYPNIENSIITAYTFTTKGKRANTLDYLPYGSKLLDNFKPLRSFIRGVERQKFYDENDFAFFNINDIIDKILHFILPTSWHDGFFYDLLSVGILFIFIAFAGVPFLFIPYIIVTGSIISFKKFSNKQVKMTGTITAVIIFLLCMFLFALVESPVMVLTLLIVTIILGWVTLTRFNDVITDKRCGVYCTGWDSYVFTQVLSVGDLMKETIDKYNVTTYTDGSKREVYAGSDTRYYRNEQREYQCLICGNTYSRTVRAYE